MHVKRTMHSINGDVLVFEKFRVARSYLCLLESGGNWFRPPSSSPQWVSVLPGLGLWSFGSWTMQTPPFPGLVYRPFEASGLYSCRTGNSEERKRPQIRGAPCGRILPALCPEPCLPLSVPAWPVAPSPLFSYQRQRLDQQTQGGHLVGRSGHSVVKP